jgi:hypothetical protein
VNCNDFETQIDGYLDGLLEPGARRSAVQHAVSCSTCDALVTSYQQATALLKTAVADRAAAVDVSGLWEAIDADLGDIRPADSRAFHRKPEKREKRWFGRWRAWGGEWRPLAIGAAAAAVALALLFGGGPSSENSPQRFARSKSKPVRIETLEVPSGYTVSTWSRPRTRTHIIAVQQASGYTLASAAPGR